MKHTHKIPDDLLISTAQIACLNAEADWNWENIKDAIQSILTMMKYMDEGLGIHTHIRNRDLLKVSFKNNGFAYCTPFMGHLEFGTRIIDNELTPASFGYMREKPYMERRIKTRIHGLIWLVLHEYCHLYVNQLKHCKQFYELIDAKFTKYFENF